MLKPSLLRKPVLVEGLTGQFSVHGTSPAGVFSIEIPGQDDGSIAFPVIPITDPDPTGAVGDYRTDWAGVLSGPVAMTIGGEQFTGTVNDGYYEGHMTHSVTPEGDDHAAWEMRYWFTFSGSWLNRNRTFGFLRYTIQGDTNYEGGGGLLTMTTTTGSWPRRRVAPSRKVRKPALASR